ncbi:subunit Exo70 of exocyst complex [Chloropicon primus]|uniref:Exocyst subunit Exo70 family protein n=1 Tax=Chloropicon primus TaxID=1764295 RepID=A0A5B8MQV4_9CHLO|nr:subunit Exo70 of exocyst complex [Chloropicon primus]|eukprot:QDZ22767.1 subunit Exo70 of exocyst complex [Chloropicon primus]
MEKQVNQVGDIKRNAVTALDELSLLAKNIDYALRPVKDATEGLSRGLANIEKSLRTTAETVEQIEASRKLQHYIDQGLPRCSTIDVVEEGLRENNVEKLEEDVNDTEKVKDYLSAVGKLETSLRFLDSHFGGIDSPRGTRERSRTRDSLVMALTHCEVEFSNRLMFISQIEQCIHSATKQNDLHLTLELRQDAITHRRQTQQQDVPALPDEFSGSHEVSYLLERRKRELRLLNMLAGTILMHRVDHTRSVSESLFTSYADVRSTSMKEKIGKVMIASLGRSLGTEDQEGALESDEEALKRLLETSAEDLQHMHWEGIQRHVKFWIQYLDCTLAHVMPERSFARKIFMDERDCSTAFAMVLKGNFDTMVSHATGIARSRKSPEKVFALLDMLNAWDKEKALTETLTDMVAVPGVAGQLASKMQEMYMLLMNSVRDTYREFTNAVERDDVGHSKSKSSSSMSSTPSKKKVPSLKWTPSKGFRMLMNNAESSFESQSSIPENATIHPLTAYLIQYCRRLQQYPNASTVLNRRATGATNVLGNDDVMGKTIAKLLNTLLKNLKIKVQRLSLSGKKQSIGEQDMQFFVDLFMLNNANYILKSAKTFQHSKALENAGFFKEMKENVQRHKNSYLHASWRLSVEWLDMIDEKLAKHQHLHNAKEVAESEKQLKQLLKQFQNTWKVRYRTQRTWFLPDPELRQTLKSNLESYIMPGYMKCAKALDEYVTASGQAYWKRLFPLMWEEQLVRKQIELQLFEGH